MITAAEDLADIKALDQSVADPRPGFPSEVVKRYIAGDNSLKIVREWRGLTQTALADLAKVNRVQIGDIESRNKSASVATMARLAAALEVDIDDIVDIER